MTVARFGTHNPYQQFHIPRRHPYKFPICCSRQLTSGKKRRFSEEHFALSTNGKITTVMLCAANPTTKIRTAIIPGTPVSKLDRYDLARYICRRHCGGTLLSLQFPNTVFGVKIKDVKCLTKLKNSDCVYRMPKYKHALKILKPDTNATWSASVYMKKGSLVVTGAKTAEDVNDALTFIKSRIDECKSP